MIRLKKSSPLYPLLLSAPRILNNTSLQAYIIFDGSPGLLRTLDPFAGHSIFRMHTELLMQWMDTHFMCGKEPYSAMKEFYRIYDITEDDFPFDTAYKIWQRWILRKKSKKHLLNSGRSVHTFTNGVGRRRETVIRHLTESFQHYALDILHHHPIPPDYIIRRVLMKELYSAGWSQQEIAESFGTSQQLVSYHISRR